VYDKLVGSRCSMLLYTRDRAGTKFKVKKENKLSEHTCMCTMPPTDGRLSARCGAVDTCARSRRRQESPR
jgi:hypothetical protein